MLFIICDEKFLIALGTVRRTDKPITDGKPGQAASAGNTLVPGAIVLLLSLLGSRYCTL